MWHEFPATRVTSFASSPETLPIPSCMVPTAKKNASTWHGRLLSPNELNTHAANRVACLNARRAVEEFVDAKPLTHVRFQERYSLVEQWLREFDRSSRLRLYLNPIRIWTTLPSVPASNETNLPTHVLFFPHRDSVRCVSMDLEEQALINELADFQPCTLVDWSEVSHFADADRLVEISRNLAQLGLVAFG